MSKETDAQYARSVDNVAYARSRCPESKKLCPKCGSEMGFVRGFPLETTQDEIVPKADDFVLFDYTHPVCPECGHEEKVGGGPSVH